VKVTIGDTDPYDAVRARPSFQERMGLVPAKDKSGQGSGCSNGRGSRQQHGSGHARGHTSEKWSGCGWDAEVENNDSCLDLASGTTTTATITPAATTTATTTTATTTTARRSIAFTPNIDITFKELLIPPGPDGAKWRKKPNRTGTAQKVQVKFNKKKTKYIRMGWDGKPIRSKKYLRQEELRKDEFAWCDKNFEIRVIWYRDLLQVYLNTFWANTSMFFLSNMVYWVLF